MQHRHLVLAFLVAIAIPLLAACGGESEPDASPPPVPPVATPEPGVAPIVPDLDPVPSGPSRFKGIENPTDEERAAWRQGRDAGTLALTVLDAGTGETVEECRYTSLRFAFSREAVDRHLPTMVDGMTPPTPEAGVHHFSLAQGWWRIRVWVPGYRATWTPRFEIRKGETTEMTLRMLRLNQLKARVLDPNGDPLDEGVLIILQGDYRGTLVIRDGIGDLPVPLDELTLNVDHGFEEMRGFRADAWPVKLRYAETTEVTIRLERP